ncbi:hypothetical protein [Alicyclobacillus fastidiosus]|uniref:Uncharacterized protein n=1 Tax=Alicyclobacillus fastidiosus TaxID=392011 RepID=A0ABV5AKI6_9BACL|nr:hypothetical protein [Alicyclobacillus fastidiosus]WEH08476.1 hypothetical protein PYS47_17535 [Alicyclobacillus fastidiosus]
MRVDLNDIQTGAYAVLRDVPPWGLMRKVGKFVGKDSLTEDESSELQNLLLINMVKEWNVKDDDGNAVPLPRNSQEGQLDFVDGRIMARLLKESRTILDSVKVDPNSENAS